MADTKTSGLGAAADVAPDDLLMAVDVSDTTMAPTGTNKKAARSLLQSYAAGTLTTDVKVQEHTATWNNAAVTFTGWDLNVTDTASNAASLLANLRVGGVTRASINKIGKLTLWGESGTAAFIESTAQFRTGAIAIGFNAAGGSALAVGSNTATLHSAIGASGFLATTNNYYGWAATISSTPDLTLFRDAADTLALRRTTNAQAFNVYNTYTDASNYERAVFKWSSNLLEIGAEAAGTGTARNVLIKANNTSVYIGTSTAFAFGVFTTSKLGLRNSTALQWTTGSSADGTAQAMLLSAAAGVIDVRGANSSAGAALSFIEQTAPAAPAANGVRLYAQDNGGGKTQLMALFASGAAQQVAIEP